MKERKREENETVKQREGRKKAVKKEGIYTE